MPGNGPTPAGLRILSLAAQHGALVEVPSGRGGWWTYRGCPALPSWGYHYVKPETVLAAPALRNLVGAGFLASDGEGALVATPAGLAALAREADRSAAAERARQVRFPATARVFLADGTLLHAGVEDVGRRVDEDGRYFVRSVDPFLHATAAEALSQPAGVRSDRSAEAPGALGIRSPMRPRPPDTEEHFAGGLSFLVPSDDIAACVVEATFGESSPGGGPAGPEAAWWPAMLHRELGLLCDYHESRMTAGLFRPLAGSDVAVTGPDWDALPFAGWDGEFGVPAGTMRERAMAARQEPSPTMLKALRLASDGGLERRKGGFWTSPACPERPAPDGDYGIPDAYVDARTVKACVARGLLAKGPAYDDPATLTEAGEACVEEAPAPRGP